MELRRPLAILDLETTGTAAEADRIVEIAVLKVHPSGGKSHYRQRVNPGIRIPPEATKVHGIRDRDVRDQPTFDSVARKLGRFLNGCDLGGFNVVKFDLPMLEAEFRRAGVLFSLKSRRVIDAYRIFTMKEPRSLPAAYQFYCRREQPRAHSASEDVQACWEVLQAQLERYPDLPRTVAGLHKYLDSREERYVDSGRRFEWRYNQPAFNFGKHRGRLLKQVAREEPDYLELMLKWDLPADTKRLVRNALRRRSQ